MKKFLLISFFLITAATCYCQQVVDTIGQSQPPESTRVEAPKPPVIKPPPVSKRLIDSSVRRVFDTASRRKPDSAFLARVQIRRDSLLADSLRRAAVPEVKAIPVDTSSYKQYMIHPWLPLNRPAVYMLINYHKQEQKDELFYLMAGIVFCLAFIRAGFGKYFRNLFVLFFQTSLRQKQNRELLLQDNLASLFINLLFFISTSLYIALLIKYKQWVPVSFWVVAAFSISALVLIYVGKFLFLRFAGWVFNTREATSAYISLVFMVNKVMGIALVPFLLIISFAQPAVADAAVTVSIGVIAMLYVYRYLVSFSAFRNKLKVNALHFFLYLCAVELLPLLLIYKVLINYIAGSF